MATFISGDQWLYGAPIEMQVGVSNKQWDLVRRNLLNVPVNSITFYAIGKGDRPVALDSDLIAIANLTGTNTIYYRAGDGIWSPVVIGSGLSFAGGILLNTGTLGALDADLNALAALTGTNNIYYRSGPNTWSPVTFASNIIFSGGMISGVGTIGPSGLQGLTGPSGAQGIPGTGIGPDLAALEALTGINTIYYRSGTNTWSPITLSTGINFINGLLTINKDTYDLEADIGVIPWNADYHVDNKIKLNAALDAMCNSGSFTFANGTVGQVLKPITCAGKTFYFQKGLKTSLKAGGQLIGLGGIGPSMGDFETCDVCYDGSHTRFVFTDANAISGEYGFLIRNAGFTLSNIQFYGNRSPGNIHAFTGARMHTLLGIEGRTQLPVGGHIIQGCNFGYACTGIRFLAGYYSDSGTFVSDESHADTSSWYKCNVFNVNTAVRSENQQALNHNFIDCALGTDSGGIIFDYVRGGLLYTTNLFVAAPHTTLLKVKDFSPNNCHYSIEFARDGFGGTVHNFTLFEAVTGDSSTDWNVRYMGNIGNENEVQYMNNLVKLNGATGGKIWFDVNNIELAPLPAGYKWDIAGPWRRLIPSGA